MRSLPISIFVAGGLFLCAPGCTNNILAPTGEQGTFLSDDTSGSTINGTENGSARRVDSAGNIVVSDDTSGVGTTITGPLDLGADGVHRLSNAAYGATIKSLTGYELSSNDIESLPADPVGFFDNNYEGQSPSAVLIDAHLDIAKHVADSVIAHRPIAWPIYSPANPQAAQTKHVSISLFGSLENWYSGARCSKMLSRRRMTRFQRMTPS